MSSIFCPVCGGSGMVAKCYFAIPCDLCQANSIGDRYTKYSDLMKPVFRDSLVKVVSTVGYWVYLRELIDVGLLKPRKRKQKSEL